MKKIMLLFISVIVLFTACGKQTDNSVEESIQTQIDPAEEFDGITLGMTKEEIISILGKKPDLIHERTYEYSSGHMEYWGEDHFNVSNADVKYYYENDILNYIEYNYNYDDPEQEQFLNDLAIIKEEILRRYPEEIRKYFSEDETILTILTENRSIFLYTFTNTLSIDVRISEYDPTEDEQIEPAEELVSITVGMPKKAIIKSYGRQPDKTHESDDLSSITYENETCFNISNADVSYHFYKDTFDFIYISYSYSKDSEEDSLQSDYNFIRKEILDRYIESATYVETTDDTFTLSLNDRSIRLSKVDDAWHYAIHVSIR
ncbi:MAG: hypothetical protein J1E40_03695 [Oscillospiraceae bacterium]|nr:hypothetical protein [Oscillospiraceae bacterium]